MEKIINIAFAYCFKEARLSTAGGSDLEHNKFVGNVSTIMRMLTSKDGHPPSYFDNAGEKVLGEDGNNIFKEILITNHNEVVKKR